MLARFWLGAGRMLIARTFALFAVVSMSGCVAKLLDGNGRWSARTEGAVIAGGGAAELALAYASYRAVVGGVSGADCRVGDPDCSSIEAGGSSVLGALMLTAVIGFASVGGIFDLGFGTYQLASGNRVFAPDPPPTTGGYPLPP
jgi:hypothetical protein